ncbi:MAG TPA: hypothetical protein VF723_07540 [Pyrinomonadaceae bacterium]|jgi:hypothetical protein
MDTTIFFSSAGAIIAIVALFFILKRVVGFFFRLALMGVLILAVLVGAWMWSRGDSSADNSNRPRPARRTTNAR